MILTITETLLYICFSILIGGLILNLVPSTNKPTIVLHPNLLRFCTLMIGILSFGPVAEVLLYFAKDIEPITLLQNVLFTFEIGKAWLATFFISILLFVLLTFNDISKRRLVAKAALGWSIVLVFTIGWASHAASLYPAGGFLAHAVHFLAVSIWTGILLIVAWFTVDSNHWQAFLRWFTPLALGCVIIIIIAGLALMQYIVPEYWNSWLLPYGEALLLKHLLLVPVLLIAILNAFVLKKQQHPLPWVKAESLLISMIFIVTGFMGQQSPPHDVSETIKSEGGVSPLIWSILGKWNPELNVTVHLSTFTIIFIVLAITFAIMMLLGIKRQKTTPSFYVLMSIMWVLSSFFAVLFSIKLT